MIDHIVHEKYMKRCIELARQGFGNTAPNPMVGSVIVYKDKIIGEGYHRIFGEAHAEVNAINSVKDKSLLKESTLYVNLEPCAHYGKTPPCANLIASLGIPNVVIGAIDTAAHVSGKGIEILKKAGCNVKTGVLESESRFLNARFFTFHEKKRPYIILKWAQTEDGFIDLEREAGSAVQPNWITNEFAKTIVHKWRSEEQAILVGANTVISDNPELTSRNWFGKNPLRIVFDHELKLNKMYKVFNHSAETIIIADIQHVNHSSGLEDVNIGIEFVDYKKDFFTQFFGILIKRNIQSIIIEGGQNVLNFFIKSGFWDEARIFTGQKKFEKGIVAPEIKGKIFMDVYLGNSNLVLMYNKTLFNQ